MNESRRHAWQVTLVALALLAGAALWALAAVFLLRTRVPADLRLPHLDPRSLFAGDELRRAAHYERFGRVEWALRLAAQLVALAVLA